jgi:hypothetical protein
MIPSFSIMGIGTDYENKAKKIKEYADMQQEANEIQNLVLELENICTQACLELQEEYNSIKSTQK